MYGASKTPLFFILFDTFNNTQAIKNLNDTFLTMHPYEKSQVKVKKLPIVAELNLKMLKFELLF